MSLRSAFERNGTTASVLAALVGAAIVAASLSLSGSLSVGGTSTFTGAATFSNTLTSTTAANTFGDLRGVVLEIGSISGTQNDWAPTGYATATHIAITGTGSIVLNGLQGGAGGRIVVITNQAGAGVADITINHENASSTAANRFDMSISDNWVLQTGESALFVYNAASARWTHISTHRFPNLFTAGLTVSGSTALQSTVSSIGTTQSFGDATTDVVSIGATLKDSGTPPALTSCGTSPTVTGGTWAFVITMGTGTPTACTATFNTTKTNPPICVAVERSSTEGVYLSSVSQTAITITARSGTTDLSSDVIDVMCIGDG